MHNILIDEEFKALIPQLSQEERAQLEANLLADGCRDPLVVWPSPTFEIRLEGGATQTLRYEDGRYQHAIDEHIGPTIAWDLDDNADDDRIDEYGDTITLDQWPNILIDGHNRHEICTRLGLPFEVVSKNFAGRDEATEWVIKNQFGRRNLSDYQRGVLALRMKPIIAKRAEEKMLAGENQHSRPSPKSDEATPIRTDTAVASLANLGKDTIRKIEHIEEVAAPEVKAIAAAGDVSINLASQFVDLPQEVQHEAIAAIAEHSEPAKEVMREAVKNHRAIGTGENEWYTPAEYVEMARAVMGGIDLDPASCAQANKVVGASAFYTKEDDGLAKDWAGRVWLNPPYSRDLMPAFVDKLRHSFVDGAVEQAILVSHNNTDTAWFHSLASVAAAICFPKKRIRFYRDEELAAPTNGQAFFYLGDEPDAFIQTFSEIGCVVRPA